MLRLTDEEAKRRRDARRQRDHGHQRLALVSRGRPEPDADRDSLAYQGQQATSRALNRLTIVFRMLGG